MSSVYISKNCFAVAHYERPFFSFLLINQDALVGCKPLLTGCPRGGGRWGDRRDPREGQVVTSAVRKCHPSWQGEASARRPSHTATASCFIAESPFWKPGRTSCLPGCSRTSTGPAGQATLQYDIGLWCSSRVFRMVLAYAPSWISAMKLTLWQGTSRVLCNLHLSKSVAKLAFPLPHHSVRKIKALRCITPVGFVIWCEILLLRNPVFDCEHGLWLCMSKEMICSASFLISNSDLPCADTWFCH